MSGTSNISGMSNDDNDNILRSRTRSAAVVD